MPLIEIATYYLIAINFVAFAAFGIDKTQAETGGWRIREDTLAAFAFFGGLPGALAGRAAFRHKTRKDSFTEKLIAGAIGNFLLIGGYYLITVVMSSSAPLDPAERAKLATIMASVHYPGCDQVRAAGRAPLHYGQPGYRTDMDGDGDGVACEPAY